MTDENVGAAMSAMVERWQCPGCACGSDTGCGQYRLTMMAPDQQPEAKLGLPEPRPAPGLRCAGHVPGTLFVPGGRVNLGLPKGFNKVGSSSTSIRLWPRGSGPTWNHLNLPVWAMEHEGHLLVRTYAPRVDRAWVDVVEGGRLADVEPRPVDVGAFLGEID